MATYYIAPDGDDTNGDGSEQNPWFTVVKAENAASSGDTIIAKDGVYNYGSEGAQRIQTSSLTLKAAGGANPEFEWGWSSGDPGGWDYDQAIRPQAKNIIIEGITTRNSPYFGIAVGSSGDGTVIRNCESHDNYLAGIYSYQTNNVTFENCKAYHNNGGDGGDSDGFQMAEAESGSIKNCEAWANGDDGYDLWESANITIENSIAYKHTGPGDGNGFKMGGGNAGGNNTVKNCVAWNNSNIGFSWNSAGGPVTFYNNTSYNNNQGYWAEGGSILKNNISYQDEKTIYSENTTEETNTWNLGISDPQFISTDTSSDDYLRLSSGSPCIDAGTDVGLKYSGTAPDLGSYEYKTSVSSEVTMKMYTGNNWTEVTSVNIIQK